MIQQLYNNCKPAINDCRLHWLDLSQWMRLRSRRHTSSLKTWGDSCPKAFWTLRTTLASWPLKVASWRSLQTGPGVLSRRWPGAACTSLVTVRLAFSFVRVCVCACVCACVRACVCMCVPVCVRVYVCVRGIQSDYINDHFWDFNVYIIVDLVKRGVFTFVGAIRCYRNDPLLLLSLLSPIVFISVKWAFHVVLQSSNENKKSKTWKYARKDVVDWVLP